MRESERELGVGERIGFTFFRGSWDAVQKVNQVWSSLERNGKAQTSHGAGPKTPGPLRLWCEQEQSTLSGMVELVLGNKGNILCRVVKHGFLKANLV